MKHLRIDRDGDIAVVSLVAPTMPPAMFAEIGEAFTGFGRDPQLRAVIVRGDAKAFSFGLDLQAAFSSWGPAFSGQGLAAGRTELWRMIRDIQATITAVAACPAPVIAAVHGWCVGGGVDLITACDLLHQLRAAAPPGDDELQQEIAIAMQAAGCAPEP